MNVHSKWIPMVALLGSAACATVPSGPPSFVAGGNVSVDGLVEMQNTEFEFVEAKPEYDLSPYTAFMLDPVDVAYKKDPNGVRMNSVIRNFELTQSQMDTFREVFQEEVESALTEGDGYDLVDTPGPNVARLTAYLIDLEVRVPTQAQASRERQYTDSYLEVTLILEVRDSQTGEILVRAAERADPTRGTHELVAVNPAWVRSDVTRMFRDWGTTMREGLDRVHATESGN
jgi:hypothetical protein